MAPETPGSQHPNQPVEKTFDLSHVFHRLNNQLGVVLANAELLESRLAVEGDKARASQVVASTLEAIATVQDLRRAVGPQPPQR